MPEDRARGREVLTLNSLESMQLTVARHIQVLRNLLTDLYKLTKSMKHASYGPDRGQRVWHAACCRFHAMGAVTGTEHSTPAAGS